MIEYWWLGLHNSVNFTGKNLMKSNYFCKFPFPFLVPASIFLEFQLPYGFYTPEVGDTYIWVLQYVNPIVKTFY